MGIFGGGYTKPGKGVDKNAPKKKGFFLFFDILIQKFTKLIGANCLYTMASILWIVALYFLGGILLSGTRIVENIASMIMSVEPEMDAAQGQGSIMVTLQLAFAMGIFTFWGSGPASAAYSYINRCFTRGEHAWIMSDSLDKFKENFKQGMIVVIIDFLVLLLGLNAAHFYYIFYLTTHNFIWLFLTYIMVLVFIIYTMMHPYLYQIMVTFECKTGALYKNAFIMTMAKLPMNILVTAIALAVFVLLFSFNPLAGALLTAVLGLCLTRYVCEFHAARVIEKTVLKSMKQKQKQPEIEYIGEDEE